MPLCPACTKQLDCDCGDTTVGQSLIGCANKKGALWIHVTDDAGKDVAHVSVKKTGDKDETKSTNEHGMVVFDPLDRGTYMAILPPLEGSVTDTLAHPAGPLKPLEKKAEIANGTIAYVGFVLSRKARLKALVVKALANKIAFTEPLVELTVTEGPEKPASCDTVGGVGDFGLVAPDEYTVTAALKPGTPANDRFELVTIAPQKGRLLPAGVEPVIFLEVKLRPTLKVELLAWKVDPKKAFEDVALPIVVTCTDPAGKHPNVERRTTNGLADFGPLPAGKYKVTVAFADADQKKYDFAALDPATLTEQEIDLELEKDGLLTFHVEPLYTHVRFIAHSLVTIPKPEWRGGALPVGYWALTPNEKNRANETLKTDEHFLSRFNGAALDEEADIEKRVELVTDILEQAEKKIKATDDDKTLKVFMVPECFWMGREGAYSSDGIFDMMAALQQLVAGDRWRHWLFAFGTVNIGYEDLAGRVQEMNNLSPVIRGGCLVPDKAHEYSRLSQKVKFCMELPKDGDLLGATATALTSEKVRYGFGATEQETLLGRLLQELIDGVCVTPHSIDRVETKFGARTMAEVFEANDLLAGDWAALRTQAQGERTRIGMTGLARRVRLARVEGTPKLAELAFTCTNYSKGSSKIEKKLWKDVAMRLVALWLERSDATVAEWLVRTPIARADVLDALVGACNDVPGFLEGTAPTLATLRKKLGDVAVELRAGGATPLFDELKTGRPGAVVSWRDATLNQLFVRLNRDFDGATYVRDYSSVIKFKARPRPERADLLERILPGCPDPAKLQLVIDELKSGDPATPLFDRLCQGKKDALPEKWQFGWVEVFRRLFDLYLSDRPQGAIADPALGKEAEHGSYQFEDFVFRCARKPGPLLVPDTAENRKAGLTNLDKLPASRKLTFGLEICADHSEGRLKKSTGTGAVDIQLVPSAGMVIQEPQVVAKAKGFVFNCDGWSVSTHKNRIETRNGRVITFRKDDWPEVAGANPLTPHSEVVKSTGGGVTGVVMAEHIDLANDVSSIFGNGPGQLHFYPVEPLPD